MGRLRTLTILLTLGAWGAATDGAPPDSAAPAADGRAKPPAPVAPVKYLEAGARLYNSGQSELAAKYLSAAQTYRDQLSADEQTMLDAYLREMAKAPAPSSPAPQPTAEVAAAAPPASAEPAQVQVQSPGSASQPAAGSIPVPAPPAGADAKAQARWLLAAAREQIRAGNYDDAAAKAAQARGLNVRWGLFDDTPAKVEAAVEKARPRSASVTPTPGGGEPVRDRNAARARLKEARAAIAANQFEQAEAIAMDVKSWNQTYGMFEDNPDKVAAAARALRRRDAARNNAPREQPSQGVYDVLVQEARQLAAAGNLDLAEEKAKRAQRMNVVPSVTSDRAGDVLHEIAMARSRQGAPKGDQAVAVAAAEGEPASAKAERDANELLAKGDGKGAAARFAEAETLRAKESGAAAEPLTLNAPDPAAAPMPAPADGPLPAPAEVAAPVAPLPAPDQPAALAPGDQVLAEARALYKSGNYAAARQAAEQVKAQKVGADAQAEELLSQIALAEQGGALAMYEAAMDAVRKGDVPRARAMLTEVAAAGDGLDDGLRAKVQGLLEKLPKDDAGKATATDRLAADDPDTLAAQKLNAEVGTKIAEARRLQETDPEKALALYAQTLKAVKASGLPESLSRTMVRRLEVAIELGKKDKVAFDAKMQDKKFRQEIELKRLRILEADKAKKDRVKDFMNKALAAYAEGKYYESETFAKKAQEIDPDNTTAPALVWKSRIERRVKTDVANRDAKEDGVITAFQEVDKSAIMDPEVQVRGLAFAHNFKDLTRERLKMNARLEPKRDPKVLAIESRLNDPVTVNFDKQPLGEAINFLSNYTGLNIALDPKALSEENVTTASPVNLHLTNVRLKNVLKLMLRPMGLTFKVDDEVLLITSPQSSTASTYQKPYYVGDLIMPPTTSSNSPAALPGMGNVQTTNGLSDASALQAQAAQMGNGVSGMASGADNVKTVKGERPRVDMSPLIQLITSSIAPGTWRVFDENGQDSGAYGMGGGFGGGGGGGADAVGDTQPIGSITPFFLSISLIIRHTAEIHDQVADLLRQLRRLQDLQVAIEVRFITVSDNFFEQIGVDFDFSIQSDALGKHSTFAIPNPLTQLFGPFGIGSLASIGGGGAAGGIAGGAAGGIGGGAAGGIGGGAAGGLGGGGAAGGLAGGGGAGGLAGGGAAGGIGGGGAGGIPTSSVITNPLRDHTLGNRLPVTVGLQGGGVGNFSPDLQMPFTQGSASLISPANATGGSGAGATFGIAFLSDLEVYLFLTATQGDTRTNILQAPKVTTFNGAPALILNTEQINFVQSLLPLVGPGSVAFLPQVASFPNGVILNVTPVVSADRRYVRMTLSPNFTAIEGFDTINVPAAVGGSGLGGGAAAINGTLQLPRFTQTTVTTTVTVPDGGTVLLGGVKRLNEERKEFGVPILSKTPWLNRLFRNVGIGRVTSSLMLMVTPRIIILEEEEERLGIPTIAL